MFPINEVSAAPHFPQPLKSALATPRPEAIVSMLALAAAGANDIEIAYRDGEIFIAFAAN
jgi:hypothetical protein